MVVGTCVPLCLLQGQMSLETNVFSLSVRSNVPFTQYRVLWVQGHVSHFLYCRDKCPQGHMSFHYLQGQVSNLLSIGTYRCRDMCPTLFNVGTSVHRDICPQGHVGILLSVGTNVHRDKWDRDMWGRDIWGRDIWDRDLCPRTL